MNSQQTSDRSKGNHSPAQTPSQQKRVTGALQKIFPAGAFDPRTQGASTPAGPIAVSLEPAEVGILADALSTCRQDNTNSGPSRFDYRNVRLPGQPGRRRLFRGTIIKTPGGISIGLTGGAYKEMRTDHAGFVCQVACHGRGGKFVLTRISDPDRQGFAQWQIGDLKLSRYRVEPDKDGLLIFHPEKGAAFKLQANGAWTLI